MVYSILGIAQNDNNIWEIVRNSFLESCLHYNCLNSHYG